MQDPKNKVKLALIVCGFILLLLLPFALMRETTPVATMSKDDTINPYPAPSDEASALIQKAAENYFYREFKQGADNYRKAIAIYESRNDYPHVAKAYHSLGDLYVWAHQPEEAEKNYQLAADFHEQVKNPMGKAESLMEIGEIYKKAERFEEAESWYLKSLVALEGMEPNRVHGQVQEARGHNHWANNKLTEAIDAFTEAKKVYSGLHYNLGVEHITNVIFRLEHNKERMHKHAVREGAFENEYRHEREQEPAPSPPQSH